MGVSSDALVYTPKTFGESKQANVVYGTAGALRCAEYNLTAAHDYDVPKAFTANKVTFSREYTKGECTTLTLPFGADTKPSGFSFFALDTDSTSNGRLYFSPSSAVEANIPYVVKSRKQGTMSFKAETNIPATPNRNSSVRANGYTMYGNLKTIAAKEANEQKMLVMNDSAIWNVAKADSAELLPFTAYMLTNNSTVSSINIPSEFNCEHYSIGDTQFDLDGDGSDEDPFYTPRVDFKDDSDFRSEKPFYTDRASYRRNMHTPWGTLCLPFAVSADNNATCEFYEISSQSNDEVTLVKLTGTIEAGRTVILRQLESEVPVEIVSAGEDIYVSNTTSDSPTSMLQGSFEETVAPKGSYVIYNNKFCLVDNLGDDVKVEAFQGYITADALGTKAESFNIVIDDKVTAIEKLNKLVDDANTEYYDVEGRRLSGLQKGVNIIKNGDKTLKVMIK